MSAVFDVSVLPFFQGGWYSNNSKGQLIAGEIESAYVRGGTLIISIIYTNGKQVACHHVLGDYSVEKPRDGMVIFRQKYGDREVRLHRPPRAQLKIRLSRRVG